MFLKILIKNLILQIHFNLINGFYLLKNWKLLNSIINLIYRYSLSCKSPIILYTFIFLCNTNLFHAIFNHIVIIIFLHFLKLP
jgi:hypothetical protein